MELSTAYWFLLALCLAAMLMQLNAAKKQTINIVFAIFCGSMAMMAAQTISADVIGEYSVWFGLGACATCNGYWLVARALFRKQNAIGVQHILYAALVSVLVISYKGIGIAEQFWLSDLSALIAASAILGEIIGLLSSSVILLSFWEGCRGWNESNAAEKKQRLIYLVTHGTALLSTTIIGTALSSTSGTNIKVWLIPFAASSIIIMTQALLMWRTSESRRKTELPETADTNATTNDIAADVDGDLAQKLDELLIKQKAFLQANLKVADLARTLDVSEYRISRVLKNHFQAGNFNRFINQLRVEHAKQLLGDRDKAHWPVLVVGLESGFASVGPFTRAFKDFNGCTPGYFRKQIL